MKWILVFSILAIVVRQMYGMRQPKENTVPLTPERRWLLIREERRLRESLCE